ncbi:type VI secretion system ImpA family N-terminal domain-containing protein [Serratia marcescens]|uniref:VasL domain-containing protein n=1 Tax=Serratia TaxID=613 RepID=UPI0018D727AD|nr:VasL domain-containing protein [Serratia marcescens]MBH2921393.1 type VI secretion system ImpA family N-terminal domain-containing protein [Serratia marcescens]MBH3026686.1 type VI secretion system ImpA family N-terminal domain-containing protein [Serratia marcescens]MBH3040151.1 type VI secretion system ImpA family N-terminal domain-containing protein [Serratia marcescens]MBH3297250.1 type VI secretion system ImpA family N-terminal domain-containing protein [Serratia marcescens]MBN5312463.
MNDSIPRKIKTGGDPRTLPDYVALRDELNKLTHPARPDVDWHYVENRCLSLFEQNGVELQTAAWYTLARTQLAGVFGLNEGLTMLEALIGHQWGVFWPQPAHARMEILSSLSRRLQQRMRMLPLNYGDLSELYRAEQLLTRLGNELQRLELKHLSQIETLRTVLHNSAVRLENSDDTSGFDTAGIVLSTTAMNGPEISADALPGVAAREKNAPDSTVRWESVPQPEHQPNVDIIAAIPVPATKWAFFAAGMCTMLVLSVAAMWGWPYLHRPDPLQAQLAASLAPLPAPLTPEQLNIFRQQSPLPQTTQTQQQITRLSELPPDWNIVYSRQLVEQAQALWPKRINPLIQQWQQQINLSVLPVDALNGWHEGMIQLQALADKLNALDGQKGRYITVSELKSQVFGMMTSFRQTVPVEEQFRQLRQLPEDSPLRPQQLLQAEQHLRAQIYSLVQEKHRD